VKEDHAHAIYCVAFNFIGLEHRDTFASVGSNRVRVYWRSHWVFPCTLLALVL
jgi:hypothetical protein